MASSVPFPQADDLVSNQGLPTPQQPASHVPNEPLVSLDDEKTVQTFLHRELSCTLLDDLYPHLYYIARKSNEHIEPLHRHIIKGRSLLISEQSSLHLVWCRQAIYLKPIPHCLFSYQFWERHLAPLDSKPTALANRRAAVGLLRSYGHLIRHESDYLLAKEHHLLPSQLTYSHFQRFIQYFRSISDQDVTMRYQYGQLRLTRLQFALRMLKLYHIVFRPSSSHDVPWGYEYRTVETGKTGSIISWLVAPFIGSFAILSIVLSAMQVLVAAQTSHASMTMCRKFAIVILVAIAVLCFVFFAVLLALFTAQFHYGWSQKAREKERNAC